MGVGKVTAAKLHAHGLRTVADVAAHSESDLVSLLGRTAGRHLHALAIGHDPRPVRHRRRSSMGAQHALGRGPHSLESVGETLQLLVDRVGRRMRRAGRLGRTVVLRMRFADYTRATRSHTLPGPPHAPICCRRRRTTCSSRPDRSSPSAVSRSSGSR